ncbi:MAG TPA: DUF192 domain-containing protein [Sphingomonas sp.]|nr:DUF192 domain-containing protein [Sphingomonas sp.]
MKAAALAALLILAAPLPAQAEIASAQHLAAVPLTIVSGKVKHLYRVEVARTPEQQQIGLMFRTKLARDHGMIFPRTPPDFASFWMKNTFIPLDLLFIRPDGTVASIAANATPLSLAEIRSGEPVAAVLELAGGEAKRSGIRPGDLVRW